MATATRVTKVTKKHKWTAAEKRELVSRIKAATKKQGKAAADERKAVLDDFAKRIGNGVTPASIQAQYYQFRGNKPAAKSTPKVTPKAKTAPKVTPKAKSPNGLGSVVQTLRGLDNNVARLEKELAAAKAAQQNYRAELAKLVG